MKALRLSKFAGPIELAKIDIPEPGPGQVLIKVAYAPINPADFAFE
jgi:NADPH2:quinone reductase